MDLCWNIERLADAGEIARAGAPAWNQLGGVHQRRHDFALEYHLLLF